MSILYPIINITLRIAITKLIIFDLSFLKMKVSGQFQNIDRASDYANIRSYIETCRIYGKNEFDSLNRLVDGNPYTFKELIDTKK